MVFHGTVIHSLSPSDLEINENAVLIVNVATGKIALMERKVDQLNEFLSGLSLLENKQYNVNTIVKKNGSMVVSDQSTHETRMHLKHTGQRFEERSIHSTWLY